jgi:TM2 domain-containing membrane protein YozV
MSNGPGSLGNIVAALCSLFVPGLGQLIQGRLLSATGWFLFASLAFLFTWLITLSLLPFGWFVASIFACVNAALYRAPGAAQTY